MDGGSKDVSGTAAKDTISIGSGDRVSGAGRMGMEVHSMPLSDLLTFLLAVFLIIRTYGELGTQKTSGLRPVRKAAAWSEINLS